MYRNTTGYAFALRQGMCVPVENDDSSGERSELVPCSSLTPSPPRFPLFPPCTSVGHRVVARRGKRRAGPQARAIQWRVHSRGDTWEGG